MTPRQRIAFATLALYLIGLVLLPRMRPRAGAEMVVAVPAETLD